MGSFGIISRNNRKTVINFIIVLVVSVIVLPLIGLYFSDSLLVVRQEPRNAGMILVLGGENTYRVEKAAELYHRGYAPKILVTGKNEVELIGKGLVSAGVPSEAILFESAARTTFENASFCLPVLVQRKVKTVLLVTSWFHSRRATSVFKAVAGTVEIVSVPTVSPDFKKYLKIDGYASRFLLSTLKRLDTGSNMVLNRYDFILIKYTVSACQFCAMLMLSKYSLFACLLSACVFANTAVANEKTLAVAEEIRQEATLANSSYLGNPLPLAAHWNTGWRAGGFSPDYQIQMIEQGHYILPGFYLPSPWDKDWISRSGYFEKAIKRAAELNIPISFISTQWERYLTDLPKYLNLPPQRNPNVVDRNGLIQKKVSPFGPETLWREVGEKWTSTAIIHKLQVWYPNPPLVLFVSNNEHSKLAWTDTGNSSRYYSEYGSGRNDEFKRKVVGDGWINHYRALQGGMRSKLVSPEWANNSKFIAYEAFGSRAFGRWPDWLNYSLYSTGRFEPWPLAWDGASLSYYVDNWNPLTDHTVMSPQIEAMNWVFMREDALRLNQDFWLEMSTWDGYEPTLANDKRKFYRMMGTEFSPERYEGYVQFGMWLLRPRVVREFRNHLSTVTRDEPYFMSVVKSVDRVHNNQILKKFWRKGQLVANNKKSHPYQSNIPDEYKSVNRWFLLDANVNPKTPWELSTKIPVFSIALVIGEKPSREWLIYSHSPLENYDNVGLEIPNYRSVNLSVTQGGTFYHVTENDNTIKILSE